MALTVPDLLQHVTPRFNRFTGEAEWQEHDLAKLEELLGEKPRRSLLIHLGSYGRKVHPVLDHLNVLPWDKRKRRDRWLIDYAGAPDTKQTRDASRAILSDAINRLRYAGCEIANVYAFEGANALQAIEIMALKPEWYAAPQICGAHHQWRDHLHGKWIAAFDNGTFSSRVGASADKHQFGKALRRKSIYVGAADEWHRRDGLTVIETPHWRLDALREVMPRLWAEAKLFTKYGD